MAHSDCSLRLEIFTKGTRFFRDCPLDLSVIQAYHPQVPRRCWQLLATASTVLLQALGRNFKKNCCSYSLLPRRENWASEKSVGEGPRPFIHFGEWGYARKGGDCLLLCLCKASLPLLAFDAERPSQTDWCTGLCLGFSTSYPAEKKGMLFSCHPWMEDDHCLSVCCLQQALVISSHSRQATAVSQKGLQAKKEGSRRGREKGKWDMHTSSD